MKTKQYIYLLAFMLGTQLHLAKAQSNLTAAQIQTVLEENFDKDGPGAAVLVARKGKVVHQGAIGKANLELGLPMRAEHVFRIGSITKQFTSVAILMLMEQGKLDLQDEITKHIPDYPMQGHSITIKHLLTHTSGIKSMTGMPGFFDNARKDMTTKEMMDYFKNEKMDFAPGEEFRYNNSGYYLLGVIIENVSGMSYEDFIEKNIFQQLGMSNSYYGNFQQVIPNRASGYQKNEGKYVNAPYLSMKIPYAAGSLLSNVSDLYKWNRALLSNKLVKAENLAKAYTPYKLNNGEEVGYGYGWGVDKVYGTQVIEHGGGIHGFLTQGIFLPKEDIFVAVFSNCNCQPPQHTAQKIAAMELGKYEPKTAVELSADLLKEYKGIYQVDDGKSKRTIKIKDGQLTSQRTGGEASALYAYAKDKFFFKKSLTLFHFNRDDSGKITSMEAIRPNGKNDTAKRTDEKIVERKAIKVAESTMKKYIGEYEMMPGFSIAITMEEGNLIAQATGQPAFPVFAETETKFFLKVVDAQLTFIKGDDGDFSKLKLNQGGQELLGTKK